MTRIAGAAGALSRRRRTAVAVVAAICAAPAVAGCGGQGSSSQGNNVIHVSLQPTTTALPVLVADKEGFFKKHGVKVDWKVTTAQISDAIVTLGKQIEVTMGTQPTLITAASQHIPVVAITGGALDSAARPSAAVVASKASGITSYKDLEGKRIGTLTLTGNIHFALLKSMKDAGVNLSSIKWVPTTVPTAGDMLKAGRVDAIEEIVPFSTKAVQAGGVSLGDPFRAVANKDYIGLWLANSKWANANQKKVLAFNAALHDAQRWLADPANAAEAKKLQGSYTGLSGPALSHTPVPEFAYATSPGQITGTLGGELGSWIKILKETSDYHGSVAPSQLLPTWASK